MHTRRLKRSPDAPVLATILAAIAFAADAVVAGPPTAVSVTNTSANPVFANLVLGQPPASPPANCTSLGEQIKSINDNRLVFASSVPNKPVRFTPQNTGITTKGYYRLAAGETITYKPTSFNCSTGTCSPAVMFNFFFTPSRYNGEPDNGCGGSSVFPNATDLAEASVNLGISGAVGPGCANADAADISAVNGINAAVALSMSGQSWPFRKASNAVFGKNANRLGVYGWGATNCVNNDGYPNPTKGCAAPNSAPRAVGGSCTTPGGTAYAPMVDPATKLEYCDERSDASSAYPQGQCVTQRPGGVTGGVVAISFKGFYKQQAN
ncbi:MAG: hypothetical protein U1E83_01015 [Methylotetracoccus sp.]